MVASNLRKMEAKIGSLEGLLSSIGGEEEIRLLSVQEQDLKHKASIDLREALRNEEIFWSSKAHSAWRTQGDRCTNFFHRIVSQQTSFTSISRMFINGHPVSDKDVIKAHLYDFYHSLYLEEVQHRPVPAGLNLQTLDQATSANLERDFSTTEIYQALNDLSGDKTPGPDGFHYGFISFAGHS